MIPLTKQDIINEIKRFRVISISEGGGEWDGRIGDHYRLSEVDGALVAEYSATGSDPWEICFVLVEAP
jgi:hypothetical protein